MDLTLLGVIGNTLLGKAVTDAYTLAKSSYNVDTSVDYQQLQSQLLEMDVFATLESTGSLLNMLKRQHDLAAYDTGLLLVQQVEETMMTIQNTLQKLVTQTERDRSRWLTLMRPAYNYASFISTLKSNLKVLETRMAHLLRLIPLLKPDDKKSSPSDLICLDIDIGPVRNSLPIKKIKLM